ncbi:MAG: carbon-nitrogen hydrolase family protein [Chloroflexi bacterium]|nr:carbon-nitrogen hydrolase family protein [Chloroflexota bacterium]
MGDVYPKLKVAAVQAAPVFLDREATVAKACRFIREAGANGARVIGFPEGFIPGHPLWFHFYPATGPESRRMSAELFKNSVEIPSAATDALAEAAREAGAYVVMGLCERRRGSYGTLFNSQLFIGPDGAILGKHQKLVPTSGERLVHTGGQGNTLHAFDTEYGRLSGLICGENSNPLAIMALIAEDAAIHVASWPNAPGRTTLPRAERGVMTGRALAFMAKAFVINVCGALSDELKEMISYSPQDREFLDNPAISGGSSIIAPDSRVIAGPMGPEEGILYADIDLNECVSGRMVHDFAGHYNRSDVFTLQVNDRVPRIFQRVGDEEESASSTAPRPGEQEAPRYQSRHEERASHYLNGE